MIIIMMHYSSTINAFDFHRSGKWSFPLQSFFMQRKIGFSVAERSVFIEAM